MNARLAGGLLDSHVSLQFTYSDGDGTSGIENVAMAMHLHLHVPTWCVDMPPAELNDSTVNNCPKMVAFLPQLAFATEVVARPLLVGVNVL